MMRGIWTSALHAGSALVSCTEGATSSPEERAELVLELPIAVDDPVVLRGFAPEALARLGAYLAGGGAPFLDVHVAAVGEDADRLPAVAGAYRATPDEVLFTPSFPWRAGLTYEVRYRPEAAPALDLPAVPMACTFSFPAEEATSATELLDVSPSADPLPANLLRLYLRFSAPMSRGEAYERVHLLDEDGAPVTLPFLELRPELWDPTRTRLTLLFELGRIKQGLRPHEDLGPPLEPVRRYTLIVDAAWLDGAGRPLAREFRRELRTGALDRTSPDVAAWKLGLPAAGSRAPLVVRFDEPVDAPIAERSLHVTDAERSALAGVGRIAADGESWSFEPDEPWRRDTHVLLADARLEDLAGNALARPFETPLGAEAGATTRAEPVERVFAIR